MIDFMDTYPRLPVTEESNCVSNNYLLWDSEDRAQTRNGLASQASCSAKYSGYLLGGKVHY